MIPYENWELVKSKLNWKTIKYWKFKIIFTNDNLKDNDVQNPELRMNSKTWLPWFIKLESVNRIKWFESSARIKIDKDWLIKIYLPTLFNQKINWKPIIEDAALFIHIDKNKIN